MADEAKKTEDKPLTAAQVAAKIGAQVRVVRRVKGAPVVNKGVYETELRPAKGEDILAFAVRDGRLIAVTIDGHKHEVTA
ncbi:MAG: hypothetical protein AB7N54_19950 [Alphaproteobacteria bacterium]